MPTEGTTSWVASLGAMQNKIPISLTGNASSGDWIPNLFFGKSSTAQPIYDNDAEAEAWVRLSEESLAMWADENPYDEDS